MSWITLDNKEIKSKEDLPNNCFGFVYRIDNLDSGKSYIGKKQCFSIYKKKFSKKKLLEISDKRLKNYSIEKRETNWKKYTGSNTDLNLDIALGNRIKKTILEFAFSKRHLTYLELKYQIIYGVLESEKWYNDSILGKFFRNIFEFKK